MFLDRLESGLLLLQTPQGLVPVELTFRQRVYLLWTFRNFRRLSLPLLNPRQIALINRLASSQVLGSHLQPNSYDPWLVIGVIENFVPPAGQNDPSATSTEALTAAKSAVPVEAAILRPETAHAKISHAPEPDASRAQGSDWSRGRAERGAATLKALTSKLPALKFPALKFPSSGHTSARGVAPRFATSLLATGATFCLCVISIIAWHRIQAIPKSEAHDQVHVQQTEFPAATNYAPSEPATVAGAPAEAPRTGKPQASEAAVESTATSAAQVATDESDRTAAASAKTYPNVSSSVVSEVHESVPAASLASSETAPVLVIIAPHEEAAVDRTPVKSAPVTLASVKPSSTVNMVAPPNEKRFRTPESGPKLPLSRQESGIQATRPPLRFVYPTCADSCARGVVALTAGLGPDGAVRNVRVLSGNRTLAAASVRAVKKWLYRPYLKDGQPVATETNIVISFFPNDAISMSYPRAVPVRR